MDRRALLRTLGVAGTAGALAGCLGGAGAPGDSPGSDDADDGTETEAPDGTETDDGNETGDETAAPDGSVVTIGDPSRVAFPEANRPHVVTVENAAADPTTLDLSVSAEGRGEVWARAVDLAAGETFELRLVEPARYAVAVRRTADGGSDVSAEVEVPLSYFDCNDSGTTVEVTASGVDTTTFATEMACHDPELADTSFDAGEGECGNPDADAADVRYEGESVRVSGTVSMPTPCHEAALSEATYDDREATLFLTVAVRDADPDRACVDCVGVRDYEATAAFDVDLPDRVVVRHARDDGTTTVVARAVRGGGD